MRPTRASIFDNLSEEQRVLWDCFSAESGGTAKLTARRSRRRPTPELRHPNIETLEWRAWRLDSDDFNTRQVERMAPWIATGLAEAFWRSPAQRGRKMGRRRRSRPGRIMLQGPSGAIELIAHPLCPDGSLNAISGPNAWAWPFDRTPITISGLLDALAHEYQQGRAPTRVEVSPRNWATLNIEMASLRRYDSSW